MIQYEEHIMLRIIHAATFCCKSNQDEDLSEHVMTLGSFLFTIRILTSNKTTSMTGVFMFASLLIV